MFHRFNQHYINDHQLAEIYFESRYLTETRSIDGKLMRRKTKTKIAVANVRMIQTGAPYGSAVIATLYGSSAEALRQQLEDRVRVIAIDFYEFKNDAEYLDDTPDKELTAWMDADDIPF